jgi:hypothetical protein
VIAMPKAKPDQVIVHRIELQEKERELAAAAIATNFAGKAVQAAGVGAAAIVGYMGVKAAYGITEDLVERWWKGTILNPEQREEFRRQAQETGMKPEGDIWSKTFHFWTGGLFLDD